MERIQTERATGFFDVVGGTDRSQAATMVLQPGQSTGGPSNYHAESDQWLFVKEGAGEAVVDDQTIGLEAGDLLLIEPGETHEIRGTGERPLVTINIYAPPEY